MLRNVLAVILRTLRKQAGFTAINVTGLAVGLACALLIFLFVRLELGYDRFHQKADRIVRLTTEVTPPNGQVTHLAFTAPPVAGALAADVPEVEHAVRLLARSGVVRYEDTIHLEDLLFVDSTVFDVFTFPLLRGDPATALDAPGTVVLTPETAERYFGDADPMHRTLTFADSISLTVTGIAAPPPPNSHLRFSFLAAYPTLAVSRSQQWGRLNGWTYAVLTEGTTPDQLAGKLPDFAQRRMGDNLAGILHLHVQPLTSIYFDSNLLGEAGPTGDRTYVVVFSIIGVFVLLVACINFMNLATARSFQRAREVGVRKVLGAQRGALVRQFLGESVLLAVAAGALALGLAAAAFPVFRELTAVDLSASALVQGSVLVRLLGVTLLVGLLAGSYPAVVLSSFRPTAVLKGKLQATGSGRLIRRGLVVVQFSISIILLVGTAVVVQQLRYVRTKALGFSREPVVTMRLENAWQQRTDVLKAAFRQEPDVLSAAAGSAVPGLPIAPRAYVPDGLDEGTLLVNTVRVDADYLATLDIPLASGRGLSADRPADADAYIINEAAVQLFGWGTPETALGKEIAEPTNGERETWPHGPVVGVVRDFHYASLHEPIHPLVLRLGEDYPFLALHLSADALPQTMERLEARWTSLAPDEPFSAWFLDERLQNLYETEQRLGRLFGYFAALAVGIACLGLVGLAAYTTARRTHEIGVRKVLGATVPGIAALLTKEYVALMAVANVLAWPLAYLAMHRWLDGFAYRVEISWWIFLWAGLAALGVALLSVSYQSIRAALTDPVKALRVE